MLPLFGLFAMSMGWLFAALMTSGLALLLLPVYGALWKFGKDKRAEEAAAKLRALLATDEKVLGSALQLPLCAVWNRRKLLALTSNRIIVIARPLWGGFQTRDFAWQDLREVVLSENSLPATFGSDLLFQMAIPGDQLSVSGISSDIAAKFYAEAQGQQRAWDEKRLARGLEEKARGSAGPSIRPGRER